jgi:RHS repeat-associated protein
MSFFSSIRSGILAGLITLAILPLRAQQTGPVSYPQMRALTGTAVITGASLPLPYTPMQGEVSRTIKNVVSLGLTETTTAYFSDNFTVTVSVNVIYGMDSTATTNFNQTLTLTYNKAGGVSYNPTNFVSFANAAYVKVTITSMASSPSTLGDGVAPLTLLTLTNEMLVWHMFALNPSSSITPTLSHTMPPASPTPDELPVNWSIPATAGNTSVQLEWSWVENELRSYYSTYELLFRGNSSRLDLPASIISYNVPLYYDGVGQLFLRARAINILSTGTLTYGPWSAVDSFPFGGHNNNLNWQVTTAYAEDGKRKVVMQYYDGSLRQRQTVTKDNSTNTTLTAETFYDGQGRPTIQVLPAPGINSIISYTQNLNLFNGQAAGADPAASFDLQSTGSTSAAISTLQTASGAALYYSPDNPEIALNANQNIPDAAGYPYSATRYTPDATGRVMTQAGVGTALTMGSGHETQYYYGNASQEELDGLFGTEVGDFSHYFKNMVQDANGQMSVSYVDMHGRTVATALAGAAPTGVTALNLSNYPGQAGTSITRNLLNGNSNAVRDNSIVSVNTLLVPVTTAYNFTYQLGPLYDSVNPCGNGSSCYNCMYDLQLAITDESGNQTPIILNYTSTNNNTANSCPAPGHLTTLAAAAGTTVIPTGNTITFSQTLTPGSYSIRKTLTVDQGAEQAFQAQSLAADTCKSLQALTDSVYTALLATSTCKVTATSLPCQSCLTNLGIYSIFKAGYLSTFPGSPQPTDSAIHALYSADSANCANLCTGTSHRLATLQQLMLSDMAPYSGQYAQNPTVVSHGSMYNKYNIFATGGSGEPFYQHPETSTGSTGHYYDAAGNIDQSIQPNNILNLSLSDSAFTNLFAPSWDSALLPHHPEYQELVFAKANLQNSYNWIEKFDTVSTWKIATDSAYTNSSGGTENYDPFFALSSSGKSTMTSYETTGSYYNNKSLWQLAYQSAISSTYTTVASQTSSASSAALTPPYSGLTTPQQDHVWQAYKGLYMALRDSLVNVYIHNNMPQPDDDSLVGQGFVLRFPKSNKESANQYGWTGFPTIGGSAPTANQADSIISMDTSRCGGYIASWVDALSQCVQLDTFTNKTTIINAITAAMETVCEKGQDQANPYGSSTVATNWPSDGAARNFEAVINPILKSYGIDTTQQYCNPFTVTWPKPYGANPAVSNELMSGIDTCSCKQFAVISAAATTAGYTPSSLSSLNTYLNLTYHDTLTQVVFNGLQSCSSLPLIYLAYDSVYQVPPADTPFTCPGGGVNMNQSCGPIKGGGENCFITCQYGNNDTAYYISLGSAQHRPFFLDCNYSGGIACLTCSRLGALVASYKTYFGSQPCAAAPIIGMTNLTPAQISYNATFAQYVNYQTGLQLSWSDYATAAYSASCDLTIYLADSSAHQTVVCASTLPLNDTTGILEVDTPCANVRNQAIAIAQSIYQQRQSGYQANFQSGFASKCLSVQSSEVFTVNYTNSEYHYTLYYYDQAGNLVKTVPPAGARPNFNPSFTRAVDSLRGLGQVDTPAHLLKTNYRYNSLNAVIAQNTPDAGSSNFWYDVLGRLVVSQNAQQFHDVTYSYTLYDSIGRITEVGLKPQSTAMTQTISQSASSLASWITTGGGTRAQITGTVYDQHECDTCFPTLMHQNNLRNRVSYVYTKSLYSDLAWYTATIYTYDVHGNVDTLLQDYLGLPAMSGNTFKRICYDYDLVSGKVNGVDYQPGASDAFYYRYLYDAENRLVTSSSSRDSITWEQDAAYNYYKHGPLARTMLGQQQTQGVDYSYTLQGWLKGTNVGNGYSAVVMDSSGSYCAPGSALPNEVVDSRIASGGPTLYQATQSITFEAGFQTYVGDTLDAIVNSGLTVCTLPGSGGGTLDTASASGITEAYPIALDAYSFSLHYYPQDYKPIGQTTTVVDVLQALGGSAAPLYNGNIAAMAVVIDPLVDTALVYSYHYDQLNRLAQMDAFKGLNYVNHTFTPVQLPDYQERPTYDPNGNITTYVRHGYGANIPMDSLTYNYYGGYNRLQRINDGAGGSYTTDLKDQGTGNNYTYDSIGNLKKDVTNGVSNIDWTVYGKIADLTNASGTITYTYDAAGNRISKLSSGTTSVYVRDAQGNILSIYTWPGSGGAMQKEVDLYGSSRLGSVGPLTVAPTTVSIGTGYGPATLSTFTRGEKSYELSNHLGNILTTITDKKIAVPSTTNSSLIDHFTADIATAQDYYPFGMLMPGRTFTASTATNYRYGFNGKENDNEVKGVGDEIDYGMRYYDPRAGRFMSLDPLQKNYPGLTPYQFSNNSPIDGIDLDGRERIDFRLTFEKDGNPRLTKISEGNTTERMSYGFWPLKHVPTHYRIEYEGQHYVFAADADLNDQEHATNISAVSGIALYPMEAMTSFLANPAASGLISDEQLYAQMEKDNIAENYKVLLASLAAGDGFYSGFGRRTSPSSITEESATAINSGNQAAAQAATRPTPAQSEQDLTPPDVQQQVAFKNGNVVPKNKKGSVRPEGYDFNNKNSYEVKNFTLARKDGIKSLVNNVVSQIRQRRANLPRGSIQNIIIDVRGQNASQGTLNEIRNKISTQAGSKNVNVYFKTTD